MIYEPFIGKKFELGRQDCFTLCSDFYRENFGISFPNIARPHDWSADKLDLISDFHKLCGFDKLDNEEHWPPRPADILATVTGSSNPNHLVIYLGGNEILHHKYMGISSKEPMRPVWKRFTSYILRHPDVPNMIPQKPLIKLEDILNERFI